VQPPTFSYGFFLPQTILIFLICIVYSVLRSSWLVLLPGLAYFMIGYIVYKYQLLYSMDHQQHSTGKGWVIIVDRIVVGLLVFQVTMAGQLALRSAFRRSVGIVPLVLLTLWFSYEYNRSYTPLMTYIALRSIRTAEHGEEERSQGRYAAESSERRMTLDESRELGLRFINPNLVIPYVSTFSVFFN
jgi:calcium permeable stress-gated cation channel